MRLSRPIQVKKYSQPLTIVVEISRGDLCGNDYLAGLLARDAQTLADVPKIIPVRLDPLRQPCLPKHTMAVFVFSRSKMQPFDRSTCRYQNVAVEHVTYSFRRLREFLAAELRVRRR